MQFYLFIDQKIEHAGTSPLPSCCPIPKGFFPPYENMAKGLSFPKEASSSFGGDPYSCIFSNLLIIASLFLGSFSKMSNISSMQTN